MYFFGYERHPLKFRINDLENIFRNFQKPAEQEFSGISGFFSQQDLSNAQQKKQRKDFRKRVLPDSCGVFPKNEVSNEQRAPGCLGYIGDDVLPSYMSIIIYNL